MAKDPIIEEVRSARQKIFAACNEDLDALLDRLQKREQLDRKLLVSGPPQSQQDREQHNRSHSQ
jgi:hypothetical protein